VSAILQTGIVVTEGNFDPITITPPEPLTPLVASVSLTPALSEAHLGEPVSLTATALDAEGSPFPGAKVCLLSAGRAQLEYYYPHSQPQHPVKSLCGVTDTQGKVTLSFTSKIPGTVGVVAAALQSGRGSVVSAPSHVMFWGQEREQGDYDRREGWWR
jgi:protocatechuate 3,4-dioxygenase beta subunit